MIVKVHKIHWDGRYTSSGETIDFEVTDTDCIVTKVTHPCADWAIDQYWIHVSKWFQSKGASIVLGEVEESQVVGTAFSKDDEYNEEEKSFRDAVNKAFRPDGRKGDEV